MFLGISYNKWHGVIPAVVMLLALTLIPIWMGHSQATFLLVFFSASITLWMLQGVNESWQAISKDLIKNYKSLKNFQTNSKDDWKWFIMGWLAGSFLGFIGFTLVDKL